MRIPIDASRQHRSDFGQVTTFDAAILRIETADGLVGWGEGKNAAGSAGTYGALVHLLNAEIAPLLVGRDARDISADLGDALQRRRAMPPPRQPATRCRSSRGAA